MNTLTKGRKDMKHKIGIICAGEAEINPVLSYLTNEKTTEKAMLKFYEGQIEGIDVVALACGGCKVNAAIAAQILIDTFGCNVMINGGTCGGMDHGLHVFDTVVATESAYWDVSGDILTEYHPFMKSIYFASDQKLVGLARKAADQSAQKVVFGRMMTGEIFIDQEKRAEINQIHKPLAVDMETGAIAHVCYVNQIPFIAVRTITDTGEESGIDTFDQNCDKASELSAGFIRKVIREMRVMVGE